MRDTAAFAATLADRGLPPQHTAIVNPPPDLVQRGEGEAPDQKRSAVAVAHRLSPRLLEIADLCANGNANKHIAQSLGITEATVKVHLKTIFRNCGVRNRTQFAAWWIRGGAGCAFPAPGFEPIEWTADNVATLRRLIAGGFDIDLVRNAFQGRASEDVLTVAFALLRTQ